jgi:glutamate-ammonia-ligase adenylyltransferase
MSRAGKQSVWTAAIKSSADSRRARHFFDALKVSGGGPLLENCSAEQARILAALFSGSQVLGNLLVARPEWLRSLEPAALEYPRRKQGLREELARRSQPAVEEQNEAAALKETRQFKQKETLRIAARDLARLGSLEDIVLELSDLADVCLESVWQIGFRQLAARYGKPFHRDAAGQWRPTAGCLLGLGKLGGQELNYSSDVDVMLVYDEEGSVFKEAPGDGKTARPVMSNHQFFNRLTEMLIAEVSRLAPEGTLYRIDLRLRPEGELGPLSRSLASYENYYAQWGQIWERLMLIKARRVAGDEALASEFLEMIQPFRYPRSVNTGVLSEVGAMKDRIETEVVKAGELERNVKLGRGGIREIEFIVQSFQLLHAGRQPFLQGSQTLAALQKLAHYEWLPVEQSRLLTAAYRFLREVEHRLQMEANLQTHTIPVSRPARERLARLMALATPEAFDAALRSHARVVRENFESLLRARGLEAQATPVRPYPPQFQGAESPWKQVLAEHGFRDPGQALRMLREFVEGPGYIHVSPRTSQLAFQLLAKFFALCPLEGRPRAGAAEARAGAPEAAAKTLSDPDRVVTRLDAFIAAYGARATLFELWNRNPTIFELLLLLFDRSEFLAEMAIRTPDLVDELVASGRLRQHKSSKETLGDLRHGISDADQHLWLRRYHQAELMRIGLRDILGLADSDQYLAELSALADACLQYALEVVLRNRKFKAAPLAIIGLGKLGGAEIDYGSDLDILFVADSKVRQVARLLPVAIEVMDLLSRRTERGVVFHTDPRLRPDGEKGLLVNTLAAGELYYRQRAQLWEIQTLTRTRPVAGHAATGAQFQTLAGTLANFAKPAPRLAAYTGDWKQQIHQMRLRIEKERTPPGGDALAIKTGRGGLMDAEFVAQTLCLENGWQEANTLRALERGRLAGALPDADKLIAGYRQLRRVEGILRRWSYEGETTLPDDPAPFRRVAVRCGFAGPDEFRRSIAASREQIRQVYSKVVGERRRSFGVR